MIEKRFSTAAKTYDQHSRPQQALIDELTRKLSTEPPAHILELGCGTGLLTRRLAERYPTVPIDASDISSGMIEHCRTAFSDQSRTSWIVADAQTFQAATAYPRSPSLDAGAWRAEHPDIFAPTSARR